MPKSGTLIQRARAENLSIREYCERKVKEHGSILRAAIKLEVSPNTVRYHLNKPEPTEKEEGEPANV